MLDAPVAMLRRCVIGCLVGLVGKIDLRLQVDDEEILLLWRRFVAGLHTILGRFVPLATSVGLHSDGTVWQHHN